MSAAPYDRLRLTALRYAVTDEAEQYVAVMRVFTAGTAGLLSDLSAREVADSLRDSHGLELDVDVVDARLSYLVSHGNLARSPRETEARSIREYLTTRARYQLTQRGELVHRQVEELLAATDEVGEVSTEMLGGILAGLRILEAYDDAALTDADPDLLAGQVATVFAQFERLVTSTRAFYASLSQVLSRYDADRRAAPWHRPGAPARPGQRRHPARRPRRRAGEQEHRPGRSRLGRTAGWSVTCRSCSRTCRRCWRVAPV